MADAIDTNLLRKVFGDYAAVKGLTLQVQQGEVFGFLGPNGAGKTTSMKMLLGLIAPTSGEASLLGAPIGNRETMRRVGHPHSARTVMVSVDFGEIETLQHKGEWDALGAMLAGEAVRLEGAGADCLILCTNTMHCVADTIAAAIAIPMLHIADPTGHAIRDAVLYGK